jgi:puromycin-sensitive aminopeptidase
VLHQQRFTYLAGDGQQPQRWHVPISLRLSVGGAVTTRKILLGPTEEQIALAGPLDWVIANAGGHGFYRVRYAPPLLERLTARLHELATPIERFNLVNDAWASTVAGLAPLVDYLELTARFRAETDRNVWTVIVNSFAYLNRLITTEARPMLEATVRDRLGPALARLGWSPDPGETELTSQLRGDLIRALGILGNDPDIQGRAREVYRTELEMVDPAVAAAVIAVTAFTGGAAEYAEFLQRFKTARTPQEEQRYLYALATVTQPELLGATLEKTLNGEVRTQDAPFVVRALMMSVYARELAWRFVKAQWEAMAAQYPASAYRRMWEGVTGLATPELEAEVLDFFRATGIQLGGKTLEQYLEQLRIAVALRARGIRLG